jgi:hypothetical protein
MLANILNKAKGLLVLALNKAVEAWNHFAAWFTEDKAQTVAATLAVSGIVCIDLVGLSFAMPFFVGAAALTIIIFHARYRPRAGCAC